MSCSTSIFSLHRKSSQKEYWKDDDSNLQKLPNFGKIAKEALQIAVVYCNGLSDF